MISQGDVMRIADKYPADHETLMKFSREILSSERSSQPIDEQQARAKVSALLQLAIKNDERYVCDCKYTRWGAVEADLHSIIQELSASQAAQAETLNRLYDEVLVKFQLMAYAEGYAQPGQCPPEKVLEYIYEQASGLYHAMLAARPETNRLET